MSPEQVLGEAPDPRSDLFSLGVVLYECITGTRPFDAPDSRAVTQRIRHDAPPPLSRATEDVPRALDAIVQRLLQKLPSDRFFDAAELEAALLDAEVGVGETPESLIATFVAGDARPTDARARAPRRRRRREPPLMLGLGAALALLVSGAATIQYAASRHAGVAAADGSRLRLAPDRAAFLRVVASPWARVIVDGEHVDTTPFARPIPLSPGRHYVRLEHPEAPTERRTIELGPSESILLDVQMSVRGAPPQPSAAAPLPTSTDPETP
jgi:serine/threonine-protein kinase